MTALPADLPAGFSLQHSSELTELNACLLQLRHERTGARFVHIACNDSNNLFAVAFRTPPEDSTGVAHILEHTVLCGSQRFPVRDPFFTMLKRSLNSFMNAFTASDWTCYPFSSQNRKDFDNLLNVYLDAAFFPLLRPLDFAQEGHRLEFSESDNPASPLCFKGVVYNEMKGAMADPASLLARRTTRHLYPDSCYRHNSGGEPSAIPDLTHQQLKDFHARCYHPSNACFFTYGTFPLADHLRQIDAQVLCRFERNAADFSVAPQPPLSAPLRVRETYPLDAGDDPAGKSLIHLAWLGCPIDDSYERLLLTLLGQLLLGNPAAPLYKALLDTGLGSHLTPGSGYHDDYRTTCFAVGLQGSEPQHQQAIEDCVLNCLAQLAHEGFSTERIEAAIHRLELANREVSGDGYPYPISLLMRLLGPWLHCDDPLSPLQFDSQLKRLRHELAEGDVFGGRIRRWLLDNPHRLTLCLAPDTALQNQQNQLEQARLADLAARLDSSGRQQLIDQARQLQQQQEQQEDVSCLPDLELSDIAAEEPRTEGQPVQDSAVALTCFEQPTNGLSYVSLYFNAAALDAELRPYVPLFCSLLTQVGAAGQSYVTLAERMEAVTGGIRCSAEILDDIANLDRFDSWIRLRGKALERNIVPLCQLLGDLATSADFSDLKRLATVIGQIKSSWENAIPGAGHSFAARAAAAGLTPAGWQREHWSGLHQLRFVRLLAARNPADLTDLADKLGRMARCLLQRGTLKAALCCGADRMAAGRQALADLFQTLPAGPVTPQTAAPFSSHTVPLAFATSVPVAYVTRNFRTVPFCHPDAAALKVLAALLRAGFLHREIREKGGAYGGMASSNSEAGLFALLSYRDPHIQRTLQVYDDAIAWACQGRFGEQDIKEAILSVFSAHDRPQSPAGRAATEFACQLQGLSWAQRQLFRDQLLQVDRNALRQAAQRYLANGPSAIGILAGEQQLQQVLPQLTELQLERL
ncbi:MAG: insulinase family protein [Desulfuromonas thiophila]|nr:insulinase family protein [Desulfuromonas thiophila]